MIDIKITRSCRGKDANEWIEKKKRRTTEGLAFGTNGAQRGF